MSRKLPVDELGNSQITGHGSKFSRKKEAAVAALLSQRTIDEAAKTAGIGTQTLHRWLKCRNFRPLIGKHGGQRLPNPMHACNSIQAPPFRRYSRLCWTLTLRRRR